MLCSGLNTLPFSSNFLQTVQCQAPSNQRIRVNRNKTLFCKAEGNPLPSIQWFKEGSPLRSGRFRYLQNGTFLVNSVRKEDAGNYECVITQSKGSASSLEMKRTVQVTVTGG